MRREPPGRGDAGRPRRILALHLPALSLERAARALEPSPAGPLAVVEGGRVIACDAAAARAGTEPGATISAALAGCGRLRLAPHAPAADLAALRALAEALLGLAPAIEVVPPDALLLDAGAAHLLPGAATGEPELLLAGRARAVAARFGFSSRAAVASGRGPALALARHGVAEVQRAAPEETAAALAPLPVAALGIGAEAEARLRGAGVATVGALARLPPEGLTLRFGAAGAAAARLARGDDPTPLEPERPEALPREAIALDGPVATAEPLLFVLGRLADRLAARLAGRGLGASRLEVLLRLEPRGAVTVSLPIARPSALAARWLPPLRERLLGLQLPGAVVEVELAAAEVAEAAADQLALGDRPEAIASLERVLSRLLGRFGDGGALGAEAVDRHRPEGAYRTVPFRPPGRAAAPRGVPAGGEGGEGVEVPLPARPTRLLAAPLPLRATGEGGRVTALRIGGAVRAVRSFEGPERLQGEWWGARLDRDYYRVGVEELGDCWIYRDGVDGGLYLHGFFD